MDLLSLLRYRQATTSAWSCNCHYYNYLSQTSIFMTPLVAPLAALTTPNIIVARVRRIWVILEARVALQWHTRVGEGGLNR